MKIAMVAPYTLFCPTSRIAEDERINQFVKSQGQMFKAFTPSDSLLQLAALTPREHDLVYMDDQYDNIDTKQQIDIAAISVITASADRAYRIAQEFKQNGVYVVMGGIHTTLCPDDAAQHADTIIVGDADDVWQSFLADFQNNTPKKRYDGGGSNITRWPPPRLDLAPRDWYYREFMQKETYSVYTTIGCNRGCKFCSNWKKPGYNHLQKKTINQIEQELASIAAYSDDYNLLIMDDNTFLDINHAREVLKLIKASNRYWVASADISVASHPSLLKLMRESGCLFLLIGFESIHEDNLLWLAPWKAKQVKNYREGIKRIRDEGINILGSFMIGLEKDTPSTFQELFDFFIESKLISAALSIITPFPGTKFRDKLIKEGRLNMTASWAEYSTYNLLFDHPTLSKEEIYDGLWWYLQQCQSPATAEHIKSIIL